MTAMKTFYKKFKGWGDVGVSVTDRGVCKIELQGPPHKRPTLTPHTLQVQKIFREIGKYLEGTHPLKLKMDLQTGTAFQRKVWTALLKIPFGEVRSYQWVARHIKNPKAVRAVGGACGANPLSLLIPCHRVIASDGKIGGFSSGLNWKRKLISFEKRCGA
ncbi:MAG: methylated-DNA--[protein]-cysteine S-methyltransferase [Deltaproteobacteria bacterium]|nr:methylated-DNA--[protein]-cysteine S-methyltransferase [Deltaproteobacteria bacterium]